MQAVGKTPRALPKPRRLARVRKSAQPQDEPPKPAEPVRQQSADEFTPRTAGDWPPDTWWP